jgi:hypothetical protein
MTLSLTTPAPWIILTADDEAIVAEIEKERSRGAALIAAALVDERLIQLIKLRLRPAKNRPDKDAHRALFGPTSSHFVRIRLGYLLQLYPQNVLELLVDINSVRNKFAHETRPIDFETRDVNEICEKIANNNLKTAWMGRQFLVEAEKHVRSPATPSFDLQDGTFHMEITLSAREAFIQGCKVILFLLAWARYVYANEFVPIAPQGPLPDILAPIRLPRGKVSRRP